jgi:enoyl-CoA hydratase/carnithine racemase
VVAKKIISKTIIMNELLQIKQYDHIAEVELHRPEKMNALNIPLFNAIIAAGEKLHQDASVRVVILHGAGRAFCAGIDISSFSLQDQDGLNAQNLVERTHGIANMWQKAVWIWRELAVPVIAAVHGIAFGGGLQIMLGADIKYVHPDTRLSIMEGKWGIIPDMAGTQLMRHTVRDDIIRELTYTNRIFSGQEAVQYGFATHTSPQPLEAARQLAKEIASKSPTAIVKAKKVLNKAPYLNESEGLMMESVEQKSLLGAPNQLEAIASGLQKRKGNFNDYRE